MIAVEHLYESCTCESGMRDGLRCADCNGRGVVAKGTKPTGESIPDSSDEDTVDVDDLDNVDVKHLRKRAADLGLSAGGSKAAIVARIRDFNVVAAAEAEADDPDRARTIASEDALEPTDDDQTA